MYAEHGGNIFDEDIRFDFSANINFLGMPQKAKQAVINSSSEWEKYPDPYCRKLRKKLAEKHKVTAKKIVCSNGADELIFKTVHCFLPKKAVIAAPCFSEYEKALNECKCEISRFMLNEKNEFFLDSAILETLDDTDMLILANPNNPTGKLIEKDLLKKICEKCLEKNIIFLCDECFIEFCEEAYDRSALCFLNENVIVLRAFTKIYAMPGLRLGYAVFGDEKKAEKTASFGQFWSVSSPALTAGEAALDEKNFIERTVLQTKTEREFLEKELKALGIKVFSADANFILLKSENMLDEILKKEKILIRNCGNFLGLDGNFFRVAVRSRGGNLQLIQALRRNLKWQKL